MAAVARDDARGRGEAGRFDAEDFGQNVREFALDAYRVLRRSDSPHDELIRLNGRVFRLLDQAPGTQTNGITLWLQAVRQKIGTRLESRFFEDKGCLVA